MHAVFNSNPSGLDAKRSDMLCVEELRYLEIADQQLVRLLGHVVVAPALLGDARRPVQDVCALLLDASKAMTTT